MTVFAAGYTPFFVRAADEFADLGHGLYRWEAYDSKSKVDLSATAFITGNDLIFVDPIPLRTAALHELVTTAGKPAVSVFVTNANHERAADVFCRTLNASRLAPKDVSALGLTAIEITGGADGETALHLPGGGGTIIVGDCLINLASHPLSLLPDKYCTDPSELRRSLARLLDLHFDRLLFAHGEPLMSGARERLAKLLG